MNKILIINKKKIGSNYKPYLIAELSANHNGKITNALKVVKAAKDSGADAIKLQTYTPDTLTINSTKKDFQIRSGNWKGNTLYKLYRKAQTPYSWHKRIFDYAKSINLTCFSTPFDETAVDLLEDLKCPAYKIASFEIVDHKLIKYIAKTGKPIILSTGMANLEEINEAVNVLKSNGCSNFALLHCVSAYPTPYDEMNLKNIEYLQNRFKTVVGLSDHSLGINVPIAAVALGASIIEKHFVLNKRIKSPDSFFSITPKDFKNLSQMIKDSWKSIGQVNFNLSKSEKQSIKFRRSIYVVKDLKKGEKFTTENIKIIRPGYGIKPKYYEKIINMKSNLNLKKGTALKKIHISNKI